MRRSIVSSETKKKLRRGTISSEKEKFVSVNKDRVTFVARGRAAGRTKEGDGWGMEVAPK